jgi:hypothetical protein
MKHGRTRRAMFALVAIAALLFASGVVLARGYGGHDLSWHTVDGGGAADLSGRKGYSLSGTAGQPEAGVLSGGGYVLGGGFWGGGAPASSHVEPELYVPLILR